ncbi:MAG TPA: hypothetical protein VN446_04360 [Candidatus Acidoferrum sp.]|nr:hypothetical protein [Candidatus Acidoferrum sp.]
MKKLLSLLVAAVMVLALGMAAGAADYGAMAGDLAAIGMFTGTDVGYELDREPTRAEVAVMLVRLLGAEETAKADFAAGTISHPFSDVADWAAPHVAYLYTNKLTDGVSDAEYGSALLCSGQMYCTFMLRALGYSDAEGGDFTYAAALDFAAEKGLADKAFVANFKRDELVAVSYQALSTPVKGGAQSLLEKLIAAGAIDGTKAAAITEKLAILKEYDALALKNVEDYKSLDCSGTMNIAATVGGQTMNMSDVYRHMKMKVDESAIEGEIVMETSDPNGGMPTIVHQWMKDGYVYIERGEERYKTQMDYSRMLETLQSSTGIAGSSMTSTAAAYMFTSVTKTQTDEGTLYEFALAPKLFNSLMGGILGNASLSADSIVSFGSMVERILIKDGAVKNIKMSFDYSVPLEGMGEMTTQYSADLTVNAIGDDVVITFPDFTDFADESAQVQGE